jgi:hypothetical protein
VKFIVTTTINHPTEATLKYLEKKDWNMVIVGDLKTPHQDYFDLEKRYSNLHYMHPDEQEKNYPELSSIIGWNKIGRRTLGFCYAYTAYPAAAELIATVDDDNIPYDNWGKDIYIGRETECDCWDSRTLYAIDPLEVTNHKDIWHRGYPLELIKDKSNIEYKGKKKITPLIQANLWDCDPDIDAICRLTKKPIVKFDDIGPFCFNKISPFNSQNTMIAREALPYYFLPPMLGRMDDIWGGYILQNQFKDSLVYAKATVYQNRNEHDVVKDLEDEIIGYRNTKKFIKDNMSLDQDFIPEKNRAFCKAYRKFFENL